MCMRMDMCMCVCAVRRMCMPMPVCMCKLCIGVWPMRGGAMHVIIYATSTTTITTTSSTAKTTMEAGGSETSTSTTTTTTSTTTTANGTKCKDGAVPKKIKIFKKTKSRTWQECRNLCDEHRNCEYFKWKVGNYQ